MYSAQIGTAVLDVKQKLKMLMLRPVSGRRLFGMVKQAFLKTKGYSKFLPAKKKAGGLQNEQFENLQRFTKSA